MTSYAASPLDPSIDRGGLERRLASYRTRVAPLILKTIPDREPKRHLYDLIADQLSRAATSITLNIAEGAGKFSRPDKRRYYLIALGSTTECAAIFDICVRLKVISEQRHAEGKRWRSWRRC